MPDDLGFKTDFEAFAHLTAPGPSSISVGTTIGKIRYHKTISGCATDKHKAQALYEKFKNTREARSVSETICWADNEVLKQLATIVGSSDDPEEKRRFLRAFAHVYSMETKKERRTAIAEAGQTILNEAVHPNYVGAFRRFKRALSKLSPELSAKEMRSAEKLYEKVFHADRGKLWAVLTKKGKHPVTKFDRIDWAIAENVATEFECDHERGFEREMHLRFGYSEVGSKVMSAFLQTILSNDTKTIWNRINAVLTDDEKKQHRIALENLPRLIIPLQVEFNPQRRRI